MKEIWFYFGQLSLAPSTTSDEIAQAGNPGAIYESSFSKACSIEDMRDWSVFSTNSRCGSQTFTLLFSEVIMALLPLCIALLAAAVRLNYLTKTSNKARRDRLWRAKVIFWIVLAATQLAQLCVTTLSSTPKTRVSIPLAVISFASSAVFIWLSDFEHRLSSRPSDILSIFLFVSISLDIIRVYSLWIIDGALAIAVLLTATEVVKLVILTLESWSKRSALREPYNTYSPETLSGMISRMWFLWLNRLLWLGYKDSLTLDMLSDLGPKMSAKNTSDRIILEWKKEDQKKPHALLYHLLRTNKWTFLAGIIPRLCLIAFTFLQPFLLARVIDHESDPDTPDSTRTWDVIGYLVVYTGIAVSTGGYMYYTIQFLTLTRGSLVALLFDKALYGNSKASGDSVSSTITLLNSDMERINLGVQQMHNTWACIIEVGISTWLLARQLGISALACLLFSLLCLVLANIVAIKATRRLKIWLNAIERRVNFTTRIVNQYRSVKMAGLSKLLQTKLLGYRKEEIKMSKTYRTYDVAIFGLTYLSNTIVPVLGFTIFVLSSSVHGSRTLDSTRAFSALTIFSLLTQAVSMFVEAILSVINAVGCFERYRRYIVREDKQEEYELEIPSSCHGIPINFIRNPDTQTISPKGMLHAPSSDRKLVTAENADIGWDDEKAVILNATFTIREGSLTVVRGGLASGKSTLLKALLGLGVIQKGSLVSRFTNAGYCSQDPWILKGTLRQNVIGPSTFDPSWYKMVLESCALDIDISRMGQGDETLIGGDGIRLSGGQQSRLGLARAVYSRHKAMILDDIFSALDPATMNTIMTRLFSRHGLFKKLNTTVIIVSNNDSLASLADSILRINEKGGIDEEINTITSAESSPVPEIEVIFDPPTPNIQSDAEKKEYRSQRPDFPTSENTDPEKAGLKRVKKGNDKVYNYYTKASGRRNVLVFMIFVMGLVFGLSFPQIWVSWWTASSSNPNYNWGNAVYIGVYFALAVFSLVCIAGGGIALMIFIVPNSSSKLHTSLVQTLFRAPVLWILRRDDGEIINRFSQDLGLVDATIPISSFTTVFSAFTCIAQAIYICVSSHYLVIIVLGCIFVLYLVQIFYLRTSRQLRILDLEATGPLVSQVLEAIQGKVTIKALGWDIAVRERQLELLDRSQKAYYLLPMVQRWLAFVLDMTVTGIAVVLVSLTVFIQGSATRTFLGAGLTGVVNFALNMNNLVQNWTILETAIQAIWRIKVFSEDTPSEETSSTLNPPENWPSAGRVSFRNVHASYVTGAIDVLEDISFDVEPGQKVGICGRTGSGKSSLLSALCKILEVSQGTITIDDLDVKCISPDLLRERLLALPQDAVLVPGNVRENLDPAGTLSDSEYIPFLQKVGLWEFLEERGGLDASVDEQLLSAGQSQLLVLARALAHPRRVIVMDEITSSLDAKTDHLIRNIVRDSFHSNTILSVAHKLQHLLDCDKVVVVGNGRLLEYDDPRVLLEQPDSHFRSLFY